MSSTSSLSPIRLHTYDLNATNRLKEVEVPDGIWFSGIVVFGKEFFYNSEGIQSCKPEGTNLGPLTKVENIGETEIPYSTFLDFIYALSESKYKPRCLDLRDNSSNNFVDDVISFLTGGNRAPKYLFQLPDNSVSFDEEILTRFIGSISALDKNSSVSFAKEARLKTYIPQEFKRNNRSPSVDLDELEKEIEELRIKQSKSFQQFEALKSNNNNNNNCINKTLSVPELNQRNSSIIRVENNLSSPSPPINKSEKKRVSFEEDKPIIINDQDDEEESSSPPPLTPLQDRIPTPPPSSTEIETETMADNEQQQPAAANNNNNNNEESEPEAPKKPQKPAEPVITFRDFDHTKDFEDLVRTIVTLLSTEEQDRLREMEDWIVKKEGTWVLSEGFNAFLGRVLHDKNLPSEGRVAMLRLMAYGGAQDDIVLILHMDRKDHLVMNYAQEFDRLPIKEQENLALLFANLFETNSASEWMLYISEWTLGSLDLSNIRVTTKVAVNALLGDTPALQDYGSAIMHNLSTKEVKAVVFDDVCTELAMAILQYFNGKPSEEYVYRCMKALNKFCTIAHREVPQLVKMIGPEPSKFNGMSPRVDQLIQQINVRLASVPMF